MTTFVIRDEVARCGEDGGANCTFWDVTQLDDSPEKEDSQTISRNPRWPGLIIRLETRRNITLYPLLPPRIPHILFQAIYGWQRVIKRSSTVASSPC